MESRAVVIIGLGWRFHTKKLVAIYSAIIYTKLMRFILLDKYMPAVGCITNIIVSCDQSKMYLVLSIEQLCNILQYA